MPKKILKTFRVCAVCGLGVMTCGAIAGFIFHAKENDAVNEFKLTEEYKQTIENELNNLENSFKNEEFLPEILVEYSTKYENINSDAHAEELLSQSENSLKKIKENSKRSKEIGTCVFLSGMTVSAGAFMTTLVADINKKDKKSPQNSFQNSGKLVKERS